MHSSLYLTRLIFLIQLLAQAAVAFKLSAETLDQHVDGRYKLLKHLGSGTFGKVYSAIDIESQRKVAVKLEKITTTIVGKKKIYRDDLSLDTEYRRYKALAGTAGIPHVWWYGVFETHYQALVIDLYDTSLRDLLRHHNGSLPLPTIITIATKLLPIVANIHNHSVIHRDIKPHNIGIRAGINKQQDEYFIFDFGISKTYMWNNEHIPFSDNKGIKGTVTYASMNAMLGYELSRRDDLESLGYTLLTLMKPLPWYWVQSDEGSTRNDFVVVRKRVESPIKDLCEGFPDAFLHYFNYVLALGFSEKPDYEYLMGLFRSHGL